MTQYALPNGNSFNSGSWVEGAGDGDGDYWDELDEGFGAGRGTGSGPDDTTTYWTSGANPSSQDLTVLLEDPTDPTVHTGHAYRIRVAKDSAGGRQLDVVQRLTEPPSTIATQSNTNISDTWTTFADSLSTGEAGNISDYTNLRIACNANAVGGGGPRAVYYSACEFECPDVAGEPFIYPDATLNPVYRM